MKEPWDWEEEDIELLIQEGVQESLELDYKACEALQKTDAKRREISKDVSAFANSAGGVIIYGVIEEHHLPIKIDVGYDPADITKEWLEQVINSKIQRRIDGIRIKQIELKQNNPGRVIYVVNIPQSKRAPHMADNHIFYKRFNYQSVPMEEYEVRDTANRADAPDLALQFCIENNSVRLDFEEDEKFSKPIALNAIITNKSVVPAMYYIVHFYIDQRLSVVSCSDFTMRQEHDLKKIYNQDFKVNIYLQNYTVHRGIMPVWREVTTQICFPDFEISIPKTNNDISYALAWSLESLGMAQKHGGAFLSVSNNQVTIVDVG